ncbi:MAG: D-cysteine desulfhydrase family protein [Anaerolineaceae bacterium]|nr:D-cysteine desulfhydrase family protein [Anaerolineaceae bacterium]MBN2677349.1 D-cysteine desulfhydrase family protein [Anaerolineaceae bacterium]
MIPRIKIACLPTPLEALPRLSSMLGGPLLYVKRDDLTGLALGGNKTRKLEFLIAEAQANGAKTLLTTGAAQSNHCRQTAAAAARFGFQCTLILSGEKPDNMAGNTLLDHLLGAQIIWVEKEKRDETLQSVFNDLRESGQRPYLIPYGGSNATGALAYAYALEELITQHQPIDWVVFASSSGGTQAGLILGVGLTQWEGQILGISVDEPEALLRERIRDLIESGSRILNKDFNAASTPILVNDDYTGAGYGMMGQPEKEAIHLFAQQEGLLLDPVYTGRAAAGLIDLIRCGYFKPTDTVVFWHTGGTPALFASPYMNLLQR